MSGTSGSYSPVSHDHGEDVLPDNFDLMPTAVGDWTGVGLKVTLPRAGQYRVEAEVRAAVVSSRPGFSTRLPRRPSGRRCAS